MNRLIFALAILAIMTGCAESAPANLHQVNYGINHTIRYVSDQRHYGEVDRWQVPTDGMGDCEDIALAKQVELTKFGIPSYLALALETGNGTWRGRNLVQSHAVLLVDTGQGTYVLDSAYDEVWKKEQLDYNWDVKVNAQDHPGYKAYQARRDADTSQPLNSVENF